MCLWGKSRIRWRNWSKLEGSRCVLQWYYERIGRSNKNVKKGASRKRNSELRTRRGLQGNCNALQKRKLRDEERESYEEKGAFFCRL